MFALLLLAAAASSDVVTAFVALSLSPSQTLIALSSSSSACCVQGCLLAALGDRARLCLVLTFFILYCSHSFRSGVFKEQAVAASHLVFSSYDSLYRRSFYDLQCYLLDTFTDGVGCITESGRTRLYVFPCVSCTILALATNFARAEPARSIALAPTFTKVRFA